MQIQIIIISLIIICLLAYYCYQKLNKSKNIFIKAIPDPELEFWAKKLGIDTNQSWSLEEIKKAVKKQIDEVEDRRQKRLQEIENLKKEVETEKSGKAELETKLTFLNKSLEKLKDDYQRDLEKLQKDNDLKSEEIKQLKSQYNDDKLPQLKEELFNSFKEVYQALKTTFEAAYFLKGKDAIKSKLEELDELIQKKQ